ncbi:MAG: hypothetical protein Q8Q54_18270 [Methylococcales bacterium]|nr:hypothetical protein [Methylococcales bacterium]MDP3840865.1 hypothetical protein [Methylococcales bacterium]
MFDSFYTNEGKEIQTKKLNCVLDNYYIGDTVPNYELNFDGATGNYYLIEEYENTSLIIINNIFVDYLIDTDHEKLRTNTNDVFKTYLANPALLSLKLSHIIKEKLNPQRTVLAKKLNTIERILREYKTYQNDPSCLEGNFARLCYRYVEKFKQGESLDSLLTEAINSEYATASSLFD